MISDEELVDFVNGNAGQGRLEEYQYLRDTFAARAPCNLLIFGVGKDSRLWVEVNAGGRTAFIEHESEWIDMTRKQVPGIEVHQVTYATKRKQARRLIERRDELFMEDLNNDVLSTPWDIIFVDSPQGGHDGRPGRMKSIYTSSVLARRCPNVDVLFHDCDREVEQMYTDRYFGAHLQHKALHTLRHYRLRSS